MIKRKNKCMHKWFVATEPKKSSHRFLETNKYYSHTDTRNAVVETRGKQINLWPQLV